MWRSQTRPRNWLLGTQTGDGCIEECLQFCRERKKVYKKRLSSRAIFGGYVLGQSGDTHSGDLVTEYTFFSLKDDSMASQAFQNRLEVVTMLFR